jgi:hypothetical protein
MAVLHGRSRQVEICRLNPSRSSIAMLDTQRLALGGLPQSGAESVRSRGPNQTGAKVSATTYRIVA